MILAAGRGERLRPLTDQTPKPLLLIAGRRLIEYHLEALRAAGAREVIVNLSWHGEQIRDALGDGSRWGVRLRYSEEGPTALETGGGIFKALSWLAPEPFVVINGDVWCDYPPARLAVPAGAMAHLVLVPNPPHHPRGDFGLDGRRVVAEAEQRFTFSGIAIYRPEFFAGCQPGRFPLLPLFQRAIAAGTLSGELYGGEWSDIGTPARLQELQTKLAARLAGDALESPVPST